MRIDITTDEGRRILILFPTRLLLNRLTVAICIRCINKSKHGGRMPRLEYSRIMPIVRELFRQRRIRGKRWVLVETEERDGERLKITL